MNVTHKVTIYLFLSMSVYDMKWNRLTSFNNVNTVKKTLEQSDCNFE